MRIAGGGGLAAMAVRLLILIGLPLILGGCSANLPASAHPSGAATVPPGTLFQGDGYSLVVPVGANWQYSRVSGSDSWSAQASGGFIGFTVDTAANLSSSEQSLEGSLGRMQNAFSAMGAAVNGNAQLVTLPNGPAYRLDGSRDGVQTIGYSFYRNGRAFMLVALGMNPSAVEAIARSFHLD